MKESKPLIKFEVGSKQPFILFFIFALITSSLFVITMLALSGFSFSGTDSLKTGDINNDGKVNTSDALEIILHEKGLTPFDGAQITAADVNSDKKTDVTDAMLIVQYSSGESKQLGIAAPVTLPAEDYEKPKPEDSSSSEEKEETPPPVQEISFNHSGSSDSGAYLTSEKDLYYTVRIVNSWQDSSGKYMYQIQMKVKNNSFSSMYSTSADVVLSGNAQVEKDWDCSAKSKENAIHVVTDDIGSIKHGKTYSCGFIISSTEQLKIENIEKP